MLASEARAKSAQRKSEIEASNVAKERARLEDIRKQSLAILPELMNLIRAGIERRVDEGGTYYEYIHYLCDDIPRLVDSETAYTVGKMITQNLEKEGYKVIKSAVMHSFSGPYWTISIDWKP